MDIVVSAEILPGKADPSAEARFANASRAGQYAQILADSSDYSAVTITDARGDVWTVDPSGR